MSEYTEFFRLPPIEPFNGVLSVGTIPVAAAGGGGGDVNFLTKKVFNVLSADWVGESSPYTITIPQSAHGFEPSDNFLVFSSIDSGGSDVRTNETYTILPNGGIVVPSTVKWDGKFIIIK